LSERLDALRGRNILYDRDGENAYLQVYTGSSGQRFVFEFAAIAVMGATVLQSLAAQARFANQGADLASVHSSRSRTWQHAS
jgi:4-hydroxyphenylpyruvate dioxygenase-like putative hemolysin